MAGAIVDFLVKRLGSTRLLIITSQCDGCSDHRREAASARLQEQNWRRVADRYADDNDRLRKTVEAYEARNVRHLPVSVKPTEIVGASTSPSPTQRNPFHVVGT